MGERLRLDSYLRSAASHSKELAPVCQTVRAIADAGCRIARMLARGPLAGSLSTIVARSRDGDGQKAFDLLTHTILRGTLVTCPVAAFASEEADDVEILDPQAPLAVAIDPLDGSSNIDTLAPIGTIFSILPMRDGDLSTPNLPFLRPGREQLAAGFLIYGPQTALVLALAEETRIFTFDPESGAFVANRTRARVPEKTHEYAINGSNARHWDPQISAYISELMAGKEGPRGVDFNTRWLASMVGDAFRILIRGGVYLYPADGRRGYRNGRLRLIYEANPIALIMERAGGAATDGKSRILDLVPTEIHQRCPLVFGSVAEVRQVADAYASGAGTDSPLFKSRSLFRKSNGLAGSLAETMA